MIQIRKLALDELNIVQSIAHRTWPETFKEILSSDQIKYMLDWMYNLQTLEKQCKEGQHFYVAEENGQALGFIGIEFDHPDTGYAKIHKIYILPDAQGLGIGKLLIQKAIEIAKEKRADHLILNVNRFNKAVSFYRHLGFSVIKEEDIDIGEGYLMEDYVMSLPIK